MESAERKQHIESIVESMHAIKHKLIACTKKSAASDTRPGITHSQWAVLAIVTKKENVGVKEIAQTLGITSSAATQLTDELVKNGYIIRKGNEQDRRALSLELSPLCKKHMQDMRTRRMEQFTEMFAHLSDTELAQYAKLNKKITDSISTT
jgi:DNA-binding MarR family transcriptional regulator